MLQQLVRQIAPCVDINKLKVSRDGPLWGKVINGILYIPPMPVLQKNIIELDKFVEGLKVFALRESSEGEVHVWEEDKLELLNIHTTDQLKELHKFLRIAGTVAVDIETRRIEWEDNKMLAIGFAWDGCRAVAIEWSKLTSETLEVLQGILSDTSITFIWHNGKFDCTRLKYLAGIDARVDEDTMLQHYACINERKGTHSLKDLGPLYLQAPQWDDELTRIRKEYARRNKCTLKEFMFDMLPMNVLLPYMQRDCIATWKLHFLFKQLYNEGTEPIYKMLCKAANVFRDIELKGFQLDMEYMEDLEVILDREFAIAEATLNKSVDKMWDPYLYVKESGAKSIPTSFNLKSPKQLKWLLEKAVGHKISGTGADIIEDLRGDNPEHDALLMALKTVRKLSKQIDTYICGFRERVCRDHRIRGSFNLQGTETGRLSSSEPNMQNVPREGSIKGIFISAPSKRLLQLDYSQAEVRVLAYLSGDKFLFKMYQEGRDIHSEMAHIVFGENFTEEERVACKTVIFGSIYGRGPASVAEQIGCNMSEARALIQKVFDYMPQAKVWIDNRRVMASRGEECINALGRRRHFVITDQSALNHIQNEYINTPVQSLASDFTLLSVMEIHEALEVKGLCAHIISMVHDSVILEVHPDHLEEVAQLGTEIMSTLPRRVLPDCLVPFKVDIKSGYRWSEIS